MVHRIVNFWRWLWKVQRWIHLRDEDTWGCGWWVFIERWACYAPDQDGRCQSWRLTVNHSRVSYQAACNHNNFYCAKIRTWSPRFNKLSSSFSIFLPLLKPHSLIGIIILFYFNGLTNLWCFCASWDCLVISHGQTMQS